MNQVIVQVDIMVIRGTGQVEKMTTWVDKKKELKTGARIILKDYDPETIWLVTHIYEQEHEAGEFDWHRKWDNNI